MIQIGQQVQLMDTRDRGQVLQIYADGRVLVRLQDGLEIDVETRDLAPTAPADAPTRQANGRSAPTPTAVRIEGLSPGLYLALERPQPTRADLYLANLLDQTVVFAIHRPAPGSDSVHSRRTTLLHGVLQQNQVQLLLTAPGSEWDKHFADLVVEWLHINPQPAEALPPAQAAVKIRGKMLAQPGAENPATGNPAVWLPLRPQARTLEETIAQAAEQAARSQPQHRISGPPGQVVDLHIEVLDPDAARLSPGEILTIQLEAFERALSSALAHHQHEVVFIHGIGKGALREAIHKRLRHNRHVKSFVLDDSPQYKYGATRVRI